MKEYMNKSCWFVIPGFHTRPLSSLPHAHLHYLAGKGSGFSQLPYINTYIPDNANGLSTKLLQGTGRRWSDDKIQTPTSCCLHSLATELFKMAAASSIQPPSVHALNQENAPFPDSDSPESRQEEDTTPEGPSLRDLSDLEPEEIERRLEKTRRELSNRRKILIKNLPQDITNQEVHDILREYELKYCYVDRNKGTAFVTLLNGDQAQDAIGSFHQTTIRGREISVQLQPTDSLLCITNLAHTFTAAQFEELVRAYGNIERCFLVYSELTGHSKGYGFVEYMKKDSASRARSELLGKQQGDRSLVVQWTDVNQLTAEHLHSKCLCVDKLPVDFCDTDELAHIFSNRYKPIFCQLAQDEDSHVRGFAVVEYETAEQAEAVLTEMDRQTIGGQEIRVSLCTPGTSGRSTLAALIAAQGVGNLGDRRACPFSDPLSLPLCCSWVPSLLGDPSRLLLQKAMGLRAAAPMTLGKGLLGDSPNEISQDPLQASAQGSAAGAGMIPYLPGRQHLGGLASGEQNGSPAAEKQPAPPGTSVPTSQPAAATFLQGVSSPSMGTLLPGTAPKAQQGMLSTSESAPPSLTQSITQTSLLGEPPKELKLPSNPYLNLASVLPGMVLQAPACSKAQSVAPHSGVYSSVLAPVSQPPTQTAAAQYSSDTSADYTQQYSQQYSQESTGSEYGKEQTQGAAATSYGDYNTYMQAVNQYYSQTQMAQTAAQAYQHRDASKEADVSKAPMAGTLHPASNGSAHSVHPAGLLPGYTPLPVIPGYLGAQQATPTPAPHPQSGQAPADWNHYYYSQARGQKREYSQLPAQDSASDGAYVGQHSQGLGAPPVMSAVLLVTAPPPAPPTSVADVECPANNRAYWYCWSLAALGNVETGTRVPLKGLHLSPTAMLHSNRNKAQ
ncbi:hypothetical protein JZ751_024922 [Albula glossodonta]|uniref:Ribonucleoprotein PTB-binding 1 n=1 Tax=Albula glossodonta TaxID=121402 RepID=A0A8T2PLU8_9TELE|nr:hypothetical protein JZ751_024922 [Albula glossodonta]